MMKSLAIISCWVTVVLLLLSACPMDTGSGNDNPNTSDQLVIHGDFSQNASFSEKGIEMSEKTGDASSAVTKIGAFPIIDNKLSIESIKNYIDAYSGPNRTLIPEQSGQ